MNNRCLTISAALLALTLLGCNAKGDKDREAMGTPQIDVAMPETDSVTLFKTYPGFIEAREKADVVGRVDGTLLSRNYEEGSYVSKGQVLFVIEPTKYRDAVNQARASLASAESQLAYAKREYEAMHTAYAANAVAEMNVVQAKSNMEQAQAAVNNARAALSTANTNLGYCTVRAPISGRISAATLDAGAFVAGAGAPVTLATIYNDNQVDAVFSISDVDASLIASAAPELLNAIPLHFKEKLSKDYTARLSYTAPAVDQATGAIALKGAVVNDAKELKNGMYVTIDLPYGSDPHAILVKDASIGTDQRGKYLYCLTDSNTVVYTPIEVGGLYRDSLRVVTSGIKPGVRYVTKALLTVRAGEKVNPVLVK